MPVAEKVIIWQNLQIAHGNIYTAAVAAALAGYQNAGDALLYYLSSGNAGITEKVESYEEEFYTTGHTRRMISLQTAINGNSKMKKQLEKNIKSIQYVVKKFKIPEETSITFYNTIEDKGAAGKYKEQGVDSNLDWFLAIGEYRIKMQCKVTRNNNDEYTMQIRYGLEDYYDWKEGQDDASFIEMLKVQGVEGVLFEILETLHKAGLARNYTNYGEILHSVTWQ